jgi:hypothetical protein
MRLRCDEHRGAWRHCVLLAPPCGRRKPRRARAAERKATFPHKAPTAPCCSRMHVCLYRPLPRPTLPGLAASLAQQRSGNELATLRRSVKVVHMHPVSGQPAPHPAWASALPGEATEPQRNHSGVSAKRQRNRHKTGTKEGRFALLAYACTAAGHAGACASWAARWGSSETAAKPQRSAALARSTALECTSALEPSPHLPGSAPDGPSAS